MKISELDKILVDVRNKNIRTLEARVKILELVDQSQQSSIMVVNPTANCERCGGLIQEGAKICKHCSGDWVS